MAASKIASLAALAFASSLIAATSAAAPADPVLVPNLWGTDGPVTCVARYGNTIYLGGRFSSVGPCTGGGVPTDARTGAPRPSFPRVAGYVFAVLPDGAGGWFIGGAFSGVEGVPRANLAHVLANGTVDDWAPDANDKVEALALRGSTLYVGGAFTTIGGESRARIAAIDVVTGRVTRWDPHANNEVACIAQRGKVVYAGGAFTSIGGQARSAIAAIDVSTGLATDWDPSARLDRYVSTNSPSPAYKAPWQNRTLRVRSLAITGNTLYAAGDFDLIGGEKRNSIAALDLASGRATAWDAKLGPPRRWYPYGDWDWPYVAAVVVEGRTVYAGGSFTSVDGRACGPLAALDRDSGRATGFGPMHPGYVEALLLRGRTLYVAGYLSTIGGAGRVNLAAVDLASGRATAWNPRANAEAMCLAAQGNTIFVGGYFFSLNDWLPRNGMAALDATTGRPTGWNPAAWGPRKFLLDGSTLYVAGSFDSIGGKARTSLAALDAASGAVTDWDPQATGEIETLALLNGVLYFGGDFPFVGGRSREGVAAVDAHTGALLPWDPLFGQGRRGVTALAARGNTVYLGGVYELFAADATTGERRTWDPHPQSLYATWYKIPALALAGDRVYIGGVFDSIGTQPRSAIAAVDTLSGKALAWDPEADGTWNLQTMLVNDIAVDEITVFAGGNFDRIGGAPRNGLAALDPVTGAATSWDPMLTGDRYAWDPFVGSVTLQDHWLFVGGDFVSAGCFPRSGFAAWELPHAPRSIARDVAAGENNVLSAKLSLECAPNPARAATAIRFMLPASAEVSLAIYDLQGRRVAAPLDRVALAAGGHETRVRTGAWQPGVYLCRLEACGRVLTRKLLVVR
jgi:hypothetical protein